MTINKRSDIRSLGPFFGCLLCGLLPAGVALGQQAA